MLNDGKNLKDSESNGSLILKDNSLFMAYTKTNKLISALYMVTDMLSEGEPLRHKLRTLGIEIISDLSSSVVNSGLSGQLEANKKITEILSLLDIAGTINLISSMNYSILKKEFIQLKQSIEESIPALKLWGGTGGLSEFFKDELPSNHNDQSIGQSIPKPFTRIGVQKGSTLMKALSDKTYFMTNNKPIPNNNFDVLKRQRRSEIIAIIKEITSGGSVSHGATITDVKSKAKGILASLGEKTLQRELVSMVKDNVLYKTGSKRWSRYFLSK